jgi:hypothetical protein
LDGGDARKKTTGGDVSSGKRRKGVAHEVLKSFIRSEKHWGAARRSWTLATSWRPRRAGERRGGSGNGHQGLTSGGAGALEVEVALASGAGAGGGRGSSPELSGGGSSSRVEQSSWRWTTRTRLQMFKISGGSL